MGVYLLLNRRSVVPTILRDFALNVYSLSAPIGEATGHRHAANDFSQAFQDRRVGSIESVAFPTTETLDFTRRSRDAVFIPGQQLDLEGNDYSQTRRHAAETKLCQRHF